MQPIPCLLEKRGNNFRNLRPIKSDSLHTSLKNSDADSIAATEVHVLASYNQPFVREPSAIHFSSLDYFIDLATKIKEINNLYPIKSSTGSESCGIILPNGTYAVQIHPFLTKQFSNKDIFGYVAYVCPLCARYTVDQLEFREGRAENRIWLTYHECTTEANATGEKRENVSSRYVKACDNRPYLLELFTRAWLKNSFHIVATKLPDLYCMDRGFIEFPDPVNPSKSICICVSKEEIIELGDNREYWAGRAVANESRPTSISEQEMRDFLSKTEHSTFGIFEIRLNDPPGWKIEYFVICLGK